MDEGDPLPAIILWIVLAVILLWMILTFVMLRRKRVRLRMPEWLTGLGRGIGRLAGFLFTPLTALSSATADALIRLFSLSESDVTEDAILRAVNEGQEQGVLQDSEADMITNIFEFSDEQARDIMTHRSDIVAIDGNLSLREANRFMLDGGNSRFPVYLDNIDHIIGILHIRDAIKYEAEHEKAADEQIRRIRGLLRKPHFVPETRNIDQLFRTMQATKTQMVVVIDEYGQTAGLVSMEDILEEIVGSIMDEYDEDEQYIAPTANENEFIIDGKTPLKDLEEQFGIDFGEEEFETVNGWLISKLDRIPEENEDFSAQISGYSFRILKVEHHMIQSVLVKKLPEEASETAAEASGR